MNRFPENLFSIAIVGCAVMMQTSFAQPQKTSKCAEGQLADEMKKLQGLWQVTRFIDASETPAPADEVATFTFEFKDDWLTMRKEKLVIGGGDPFKYALDPSKSPKAIDINFLGGPDDATEGIYKLDGDELKICIVAGTRDGKPAARPSEFKASKRDLYSLFVLKRVKK